MNAPLFSIIMPVYNTEKYITKSIESVLNQTFTDFELICVNDKTKDKAFDICKEYSKKDNRIICIDLASNVGVSETRNSGLEIARGKYVCFLDSDDELKKQSLEELNDVIQENKPQLIIFGYQNIYSDKSTSSVLASLDSQLLDKSSINKFVLTKFKHELLSCVGSKVYETKFLKDNKIRFEDKYRYNEDVAICLSALACSKNAYYLNKDLYIYNRREAGSTMSSYKPNIFNSLFLARELYISFISDFTNNFPSEQKTNFYNVILGGIHECLKNEKRYASKETFNIVVNRVKNYKYFKLLTEYFARNKREINFKKRIFIKCIKHCNCSLLWRFVK